MRSIHHTILVFAALVGALMLYGCVDQSNNASFEDSIAPYLELEQLSGATNSTFTVNVGESSGLDSYFSFEIGNSGDNPIVPRKATEGWCVEWDRPISSSGNSYHDISLYSTYGSKTWKPANYLISIADELRAQDPAITYREIQVALWSVIEEPKFDMDSAISSGEMPPRLMENGEPNFSMDKVREIVEKVRIGSQDFSYSSNDTYLLLSNKGEYQNGGTPVKCGSFRTQTPGGWGAQPSGNNAGQYVADNFDTAFPNGITIGGEFTATFTSASAIEAYLPDGGNPEVLTQNYTNPTGGLGTFAMHVLALELAVGFDKADPNFSNSTFYLEDLIIASDDFNGETIAEILAEANRVLGGGAEDLYTAKQLKDIIDDINNAFTDGDVKVKDQEVVKCPTVIRDAV